MAVKVYQFIFLFVFSLTTSSALKQEGWEKVHNANYSSILPLQHYNDKSYYMGIHLRAHYEQALEFCKHMNMELLSIRSADENNRIWNLIKQADVDKNKYWTSGSRLVDGKSWLWLPYGEKIDYWPNSRPVGDDDHCLELWRVGDGLHWYNRDCETRNWFICERYHDSNVGSPNS